MSEKRIQGSLVLILCGLVLIMAGGCAKKKVETAAQVTEERIAPSREAEEAFPQEARVREGEIEEAFPQEARVREGEIKEGRALPGLGDVFFDFDRFDIRSDARKVLNESARWLEENSEIRITIEGHADERGTSEYNLALAERRAMAVKRYLVALGIDSGQIQTISYGEERPFCLQHNERCWQQNRRGHFVPAD